MKFEDHVSSRIWCERLYDLGVRGRSEFSWEPNWDGTWTLLLARESTEDAIPAWTVGELGCALPETIKIGNAAGVLVTGKPLGRWVVSYRKDGPLLEKDGFTEADARAGMVCRLVELGIVSAHWVNKRLAE